MSSNNMHRYDVVLSGQRAVMWTAGKSAAREKVLSMGISDAVQEAMVGAASGIPLGTGASLAVSVLTPS
jgi:hypothetical protein